MISQPRRRAFLPLPVLAAGLLMLGACASGSGGESSDWTAPPSAQDSGTALPPPGAPGGGASEGLPPVANQEVPVQAQEGEGAEGEENVIVKGPDGTTWALSREADQEAYQADIEDCYNYAWAQTRRDAQITDDRNAGIDTLTNQSRYSVLRQRVDEFDLRNRRGALLTECMEAKGYARTDPVLPRVVF